MSNSFSLKQYNTFGVDVNAQAIHTFSSPEELKSLLNIYPKHLILGGGSNVLFTKSFDGAVLVNQISGVSVISENENELIVEAGAGEVWHEFVMYCVKNNWAGLENLSLIPGSVGASPMQNIGAYGVEIKDVFHSLDALKISNGSIHTFNKEECAFGYRESVFKRALKDQFVICKVRFNLKKKAELNISYGAISEELKALNKKEFGIQDVSQAVINIRNSKLPNPKVLGNAGSFFKNPVISSETFEKIGKNYPNIPNYPQADGTVKLAAGWLIEQTGLKGYKEGNCGIHDKQALVLVNFGGATGEEIYNLSQKVIDLVNARFDITLEREVNIL